jgi:hypothetical protein
MSEPRTSPQDTEARLAAAREAIRADAFRLARDTGAGIITRPVFSGRAEPTTPDVEPLAGARAARDLEHAARRAARDYIRLAREAGHDWDQIGHTLGMDTGRDAEPGASPADAAYTYAAGHPDTEAPWRPRSFTWTCRSCDEHITDRGLIQGPADDEPGHAGNCSRLAPEIAAWDAETARWEADWEAGQ